MKKLLLAVSILGLSAGTAFAQVTPSTPLPGVTGPDLSALTPLPGSTTQGALIEQVASTSSSANINQRGSSFGLAHIEQMGLTLDAVIRQRKTDVSLAGSSLADIDQSGINARARLFQNHDSVGTADNEGFISQNASGTSLLPSGYSLNAFINQDGSGNQSSIEQGTSTAGTVGAISGYSGRNDQTGANNTSAIVQDATVFADTLVGTGDVNVFQTGSNNASFAGQSGDVVFLAVEQTGINHSSNAIQGGTDSTIEVVQLDSDHSSDIFQGGTFLLTEVSQSGSTNSSTVLQGGLANLGTENSVVVSQTGDRNSSDVDQGELSTTSTDNSLLADVEQTTDDNFASIFQRGDQNSAFIIQTDTSANFGGINQSGTLLTATVTQ